MASISNAVESFDKLPDSALVSITEAQSVTGRSRASIYRHFHAGDLKLVKVGCSTRVRVSDIRKLIGAS
jgi:hypothetical protein